VSWWHRCHREYTPKRRTWQPASKLRLVQHQKRVTGALPLDHGFVHVYLLQRRAARTAPQHTSLLDIQLGPVQAEHPKVSTKLRAYVIRTGIGLALRLQVHQHKLLMIILTTKQAIKAACNVALYIRQPVLTRNRLIGIPNGMFKQWFILFLVFLWILTSVTSRQDVLQR